ncbi:MAG: DUF2252 domain-containing protein [Actinobacteria bacterium]|nr:DUF2252 domain-containing protein [Actinomycetota bacterium]MCB8996741.1 DUF2252 domain-containing protein [Actinomycetota bacterium]
MWHGLKSAGTLDERVQRGLDARQRVPHDAHTDLYRSQVRPDPLKLVLEQDQDRIPALIGVRHERMAKNVHSYLRGSDVVMAADLAVTPVSEIHVQACGDVDACTFGYYRSPDGDAVFDLGYFDETLRAPWEWDVKRMAVAMVLAMRVADAPSKDQRAVARAAVDGYRRGMAWAADHDRLNLWFAGLPEPEVARAVDKSARRQKDLAFTDEPMLYADMVEQDGTAPRLRHSAPVYALTDWLYEQDAVLVHEGLIDVMSAYFTSVSPEVQQMLTEYRIADVAMLVRGVSDVGLRTFVVLLQGTRRHELVALQVKEARQSVLQPYVLPEFRHRGNQARRIALGQALIQSEPDPLLGFSRWRDRDYFFSQLRPVVTSYQRMGPEAMPRYARLCGFALARAHAVTGDRIAIDAYLGDSDSFPKAVARYAVRYADLVESDYSQFAKHVGEAPTTG